MIPRTEKINSKSFRKILKLCGAWTAKKISVSVINKVITTDIVAIHKTKRKLHHIFDRVAAFADALQTTGKKVEPDFLQLGTELQSVHTQARILTEKIIASATLLDSKSENSFLFKMGKLVKGSLKELEDYQTEIRTNLVYINEGAGHLLSLYHLCPRLGKIALALKMVGLNTGVESARFRESEELFAVVTREIVLLSKRVLEIVDKIHDHSETAYSGQVFAYQNISRDLKTLMELSKLATQAVQNAVSEIDQLMNFSLGVMEKGAERSEKISRQIGKIVVGIQFHDKMSQRMDHITKGLQDVLEIIGEGHFSGVSYSGMREKINSIRSILTLQMEQLFKVISEINIVYENGMRAFNEISNEVKGIADNLSGFGSKEGKRLDNGNEEAEDPFSVLNSAVLNLNFLLGKGNELVGKTRRTTNQASKMAMMLSGYVKDIRGINVEAHILAINTIIKAAHLGNNGKTLEVLGQEMKNLSDQTNLLVSDVEKNLSGLADAIKHLQGMNPEIEEDSFRREMFEDLLGQYKQEMMSNKEQFDDYYLDAHKMGARLQSAISRTISDLGFLPRISEELQKHHKEIENIILMIAPLEYGKNTTSKQTIEMLSARYTMQDERDTHEKILERGAEVVYSEIMDSSRISEIVEETQILYDSEMTKENIPLGSDEFGDNVELF